MQYSVFLDDANAQFGVIGPPVLLSVIEAIFPTPFPGREDIIAFYLRYNGGSRAEYQGFFHCGSPDHRASRDHLERTQVEGFFTINSDPDKKVVGFRSMLCNRATYVRTFSKPSAADTSEVLKFIEEHMPIAFGHSGDEFWINLKDGRIRYVLWGSWQEGPIDFAPSFRDFVYQHWNNTESLWGEHQFTDGVQQFEADTGLKYGTKEAIAYAAQRNKESKR